MIFFQYGSYSCLWIFSISLTVFFRNTNYLCIYSLVFNIHIFCIYVRSQIAPWNLPVSGLCSKTISEMGSSSGSSRYSFFLFHTFHMVFFPIPFFIFEQVEIYSYLVFVEKQESWSTFGSILFIGFMRCAQHLLKPRFPAWLPLMHPSSTEVPPCSTSTV